MAYISRDPFARQELHRRTVKQNYGNSLRCSWCGSKNARGNLFEYRIESDGGRSSIIRGLFCSVQCMKDYHA